MSDAGDVLDIYFKDTGLDKLLSAPDTEDVAIQEPGKAWRLANGEWRCHELPELTLFLIENIAVVAASAGHQEALTTSIVDCTEPVGPHGHRLNIIAPPNVPRGSIALVFRKPDERVAPMSSIGDRYETEGWNQYRERSSSGHSNRAPLLKLYRSKDISGFLTGCVESLQNILMVGMTGASKTSLGKTTIEAIPFSDRVITVEDSKELVIPQPNHVRLIFQRNDLLERVVHADTLLQATFRMRADRVILGEIRGKEAMTFVNHVMPAHPGTISTIHGHSAAAGMQRLLALLQTATNIPEETLKRFIAASIDVVIPLHRQPPDPVTGKRFRINPIWFAADAEEYGESALELMQ